MSELIKKISGDDYRFPRWRNTKREKAKLRVPQGENTSGRKSANKPKQWKQKVSAFTLGCMLFLLAPFIALSSSSRLFSVTRKTSKGQLKDVSLLYAFIAFGFLEVSLKINWCILQWNIFFFCDMCNQILFSHNYIKMHF